jgi:hypothetical protein
MSGDDSQEVTDRLSIRLIFTDLLYPDIFLLLYEQRKFAKSVRVC